MKVLLPLTSNGRAPINQSLKKLLLSVFYGNGKHKVEIIGFTEQLFEDDNHRQLVALGIDLRSIEETSFTGKFFALRKLVIQESINLVHCSGYKDLFLFSVIRLFLIHRVKVVMT